MALQGRQGMTKALKKVARLASMTSNRKRDKRNQRASYHREFKNTKGPRQRSYNDLGFLGRK